MDNYNNQIARLDNSKLFDLINKMDSLSETDKRQLTQKIISDDVEVRRSALEKMMLSSIAHNDLMTIMGELQAMNKEGMYVKSKQVIKTGSGTFEIESRGGDRKLIIPIIVTVAIVVFAALVIIFWKR